MIKSPGSQRPQVGGLTDYSAVLGQKGSKGLKHGAEAALAHHVSCGFDEHRAWDVQHDAVFRRRSRRNGLGLKRHSAALGLRVSADLGFVDLHPAALRFYLQPTRKN